MENTPLYTFLKSFQYSSETYIYKGKLESEGIEVFLKDNNIVDANPLYSTAVNGVKLFVKTEDLEKSIEVLKSINEFSLDENLNSINCPKCQSTRIEMYTSVKDIKSLVSFLLFFLFSMPTILKHKYKCRDCNFEFNTK